VRNLEHFAQLVGDKDDRVPGRSELTHHAKQLLNLLRGQHRSGLIQDEDAGATIERLENLNSLLDAHWQVLNNGIGIDRKPILLCKLHHAGSSG